MTVEHTANITSRYYLTLEEAKQGFSLATFGKRKFTQYITPLVSIVIVIWGAIIGWNGVGKYYIILGLGFLALQLLMRFVLLPAMFKRQYEKMNFQNTEHGIDLYQDYMVLTVGDSQQQTSYSEVAKFSSGDLVYVLELKNKALMLISKKAIQETGQQELFESVLQNCQK